MSAECHAILRELDLLRAADPELKIFGARTHRYELNSVLAESEILSFETKHRISLPSEYREFLLTVGNGGAGPAYGVERLGRTYGTDWAELPGLVGDLCQPFPYTDSWNAQPIDGSRPVEDKYRQQDEYWGSLQVSGAIPICHLGCNQRQCLIVTGPERGNIWFDDRADWQGLYPDTRDHRVRLNFFEWYRLWLDASLHECSVQAP